MANTLQPSYQSFYLPGSIDIHDNQMEQWNLKPPLLYLWSRSDWTEKHKAIAIRQGHISKQPEESPVKENHEETGVKGQEEDQDIYGDIAKMLNDLPVLNDQVEAPEVTSTFFHEDMEISPSISPSKRDNQTDQSRHKDEDSRTDQSRHDKDDDRSRRESDDGREDQESHRHRNNKRFAESFVERKTEQEYKRKQSRSKDEGWKDKHGRSRTPVGEFYDKGTPRSVSSPSNRNDSRSFLEDHPSEALVTSLGRERSEDGFLRFQHDCSGSATEFGTGYGVTRMSIPDEELNDIERRYRNPYTDVHSRIETFGRQYVDPLEKYGHSSADIFSRQAPLYGRQGPNDVPYRSWLPSGQDSGLGQTGSLSNSFGLSTFAPDPSRLGSSVTQRYAPRLDEMNYTRSSPFTPTDQVPPSSIYNSSGSRAGLYTSDIQDFATGPHRHFPHHNSSGWLND